MADASATNFGNSRWSEALRCLSKPRSPGDDYKKGERDIYQLHRDIATFLDASGEDLKSVVGHHGQLGHVLVHLCRDAIGLVSRRCYALLVKNVSWFYRPDEPGDLAVRATRWSQDLLRSTLVHPAVSRRTATSSSHGLRLPPSQWLELAKEAYAARIATHAWDASVLAGAAEDGLVLLNDEGPSAEWFATIVDVLPPFDRGSEDARAFYASLGERLSKDPSRHSDALHRKLSRKYAIHLENELVRLLDDWLEGRCELNSWPVSGIREDRRLSSVAFRVLNAILAATDDHPSVREFVQRLTRRAHKATRLSEVGPRRLASLVYLLEWDPAESDDATAAHAVRLSKALTSATTTGTLSRAEAARLRRRFPRWFRRIRRLEEEGDARVKMEVATLRHRLASDDDDDDTLNTRRRDTGLRDDVLIK